MDPNNIDPAGGWTHARFVEFHPRHPEWWATWAPFTVPVDAETDEEAIVKAEAAIAVLLPKLAPEIVGRVQTVYVTRPTP